MSMSLTDLPPELVSCIVTNIASRPTLSNLARCSRQCNLLTIPHLYHCVVIREEVRLGEHHDGQLRNLASLLMQKPDLAQHVRHFELHVEWLKMRVTASKSAQRLERYDEAEEELMTAAAKTSSLSEEEKIERMGRFSHTHRCYHDLILAFLLPVLPRLETLVLDVKLAFGANHLEHMFYKVAHRKPPFDVQPAFEKLKVFVHSHDLFCARSVGYLVSLLKLPAIEEISGGFQSDFVVSHHENGWILDGNEHVDPSGLRESEHEVIGLDSSSSPLTSLDLVSYSLSTEALAHILRAPKALKSVFFTVSAFAKNNFKDLCHILKPHENCLESLSIDCSPVYEAHNPLLGGRDSFLNFTSLKLFKTAAFYYERMLDESGRLGLLDIFPPGIETLHLTQFETCSRRLLEALEYLLAQKSPRHLPLLAKLILETECLEARDFFAEPAAQGTAKPRLLGLAATQGVSIVLKGRWIDQGPVIDSGAET